MQSSRQLDQGCLFPLGSHLKGGEEVLFVLQHGVWERTHRPRLEAEGGRRHPVHPLLPRHLQQLDA